MGLIASGNVTESGSVLVDLGKASENRFPGWDRFSLAAYGTWDSADLYLYHQITAAIALPISWIAHDGTATPMTASANAVFSFSTKFPLLTLAFITGGGSQDLNWEVWN